MTPAESTPQGAPDAAPEAAPESEQERAARIAAQEARLRHFALLLIASGALLLGGGAWWRGVDFAGAVLLGFLIVLVNFFWTKRTVKSVLLSGQPRALLALSFLVKFGVTAALLFYAILVWGVDGLGVMVGLSALVLATLAYALELGRRH